MGLERQSFTAKVKEVTDSDNADNSKQYFDANVGDGMDTGDAGTVKEGYLAKVKDGKDNRYNHEAGADKIEDDDWGIEADPDFQCDAWNPKCNRSSGPSPAGGSGASKDAFILAGLARPRRLRLRGRPRTLEPDEVYIGRGSQKFNLAP